jgi:hypothetical protein
MQEHAGLLSAQSRKRPAVTHEAIATPSKKMRLGRDTSRSLLPTITNLLEKDHPMEFSAAPILDTEPQPTYDDPFDDSDPLFNHCVCHCRHNRCMRLRRSAGARAKRARSEFSFQCTCSPDHIGQQNPIGQQKADSHGSPQPSKDISLSTTLCADEILALENLDIHKEVEIRLVDVRHFIKELQRTDIMDFAGVLGSKAFQRYVRNDPRFLHKIIRDGREMMLVDTFRYFNLTFSNGPNDTDSTKSRMISPQSLKLEITAYLGPTLYEWFQKLSGVPEIFRKGPGYFPARLLQLMHKYPFLEEVWNSWDQAVDALIRLFVLRDLRTQDKEDNEASIEHEKKRKLTFSHATVSCEEGSQPRSGKRCKTGDMADVSGAVEAVGVDPPKEEQQKRYRWDVPAKYQLKSYRRLANGLSSSACSHDGGNFETLPTAAGQLATL